MGMKKILNESVGNRANYSSFHRTEIYYIQLLHHKGKTGLEHV